MYNIRRSVCMFLCQICTSSPKAKWIAETSARARDLENAFPSIPFNPIQWPNALVLSPLSLCVCVCQWVPMCVFCNAVNIPQINHTHTSDVRLVSVSPISQFCCVFGVLLLNKSECRNISSAVSAFGRMCCACPIRAVRDLYLPAYSMCVVCLCLASSHRVIIRIKVMHATQNPFSPQRIFVFGSVVVSNKAKRTARQC